MEKSSSNSTRETNRSSPLASRLVSLDAYRGFVMLAMASSGLGFASIVQRHPEVVERQNGTAFEGFWRGLWDLLAYQFSHVEWTGCSFWDLIQPSFMFMVGVSLPFSFARRSTRVRDGKSQGSFFGHAIVRSLILILLGVFLSSQSGRVANFTFVNVLTQIGLGYFVVVLLLGRSPKLQLAVAAIILVGYWFWFVRYEIPQNQRALVQEYLETMVQPKQRPNEPKNEITDFQGLASHWNKHVNAAAEADRTLLNVFPRNEPEWRGQKFWVNSGGYQTLNFIPSIATMIFGLMAGTLLFQTVSPTRAVRTLIYSGLLCFLLAMAADTTIWPVSLNGFDWTICPAVKRIWTPTWAIFSTGWCLWFLAMFYWVIDIKGWKRLAWPLAIVGMNSIAVYVMAQLLRGWVDRILNIWLTTFDEMLGTSTAGWFYSPDSVMAPLWKSLAFVFVLWLISWWMYRRRLFVRI